MESELGNDMASECLSCEDVSAEMMREFAEDFDCVDKELNGGGMYTALSMFINMLLRQRVLREYTAVLEPCELQFFTGLSRLSESLADDAIAVINGKLLALCGNRPEGNFERVVMDMGARAIKELKAKEALIATATKKRDAAAAQREANKQTKTKA